MEIGEARSRMSAALSCGRLLCRSPRPRNERALPALALGLLEAPRRRPFAIGCGSLVLGGQATTRRARALPAPKAESRGAARRRRVSRCGRAVCDAGLCCVRTSCLCAFAAVSLWVSVSALLFVRERSVTYILLIHKNVDKGGHGYRIRSGRASSFAGATRVF